VPAIGRSAANGNQSEIDGRDLPAHRGGTLSAIAAPAVAARVAS
jgi:hypothetical protein